MFTLAGARILPLHWGYTSTKMFLLWEKLKITHVGSKNLLFKISIYDISIFQEGDPGIPCGAYSVTGASMSRLQVATHQDHHHYYRHYQHHRQDFTIIKEYTK